MLDVKGVLLLSIWIVLPSFKEFWLCTARQWGYLRFSLIYWDLFLCFVRTGQLHSLHILPRLCSKSFKVGFSSTWTKNFQMYKLNLEKAEESEIKLPTFTGSWRKQESSRKTSTSASLTMLKSWTMWITTNCEKFLEIGKPDHLTYLLRNLYTGQEATIRTLHGTTDWFKIGKGGRQGCVLSLCLFNLYAEYIMCNAKWMNHKL